MKKGKLFCFSRDQQNAGLLAKQLNLSLGSMNVRQFPDEETYIRIDSEVSGENAIVYCSLDRPNEKLIPLLFLGRTLKELGAKRVILVVPYLAYMRQDRAFQKGEAISSRYVAELLSGICDHLITVDPHLHRRRELGEIYSVSSTVLHAADAISEWIRASVNRPLIVGPDSESQQWVSQVARDIDAPYIVLRKERHGDRDVEITVQGVEKYLDRTPVLVDDIISSARTMAVSAEGLREAGLPPPVCVGVHAIFAPGAQAALKDAGVQQVATCNSIPHETNAIDLSNLLATALQPFL